jgi:hypothetical protein
LGLRGNITREWGKLRNEVLRNLSFTHRIIEVIKYVEETGEVKKETF